MRLPRVLEQTTDAFGVLRTTRRAVVHLADLLNARAHNSRLQQHIHALGLSETLGEAVFRERDTAGQGGCSTSPGSMSALTATIRSG